MESNDFVFLSYSNKDKDFVLRLNDDLKRNGIKTWFDIEQINPGSLWQDEIKNGIEKSNIVLVILSENYYSSKWVSIELALSNNKNIIPIKIDDAIYDTIPTSISNRQWIDFSQNYSNGLNLLLQSIPNNIKNDQPIKSSSALSKGYVFLSFCDEDSSFVMKLRSFLKSQGFAYWDFQEGERNYQIQFFLELESVIQDSVAVLSLISPSWKNSKWSIREYLYSEEIGKPIFLLRIKETNPILAIAGQPYIDFVINSGNGFINLEKELSKRLK